MVSDAVMLELVIFFGLILNALRFDRFEKLKWDGISGRPNH